MNKIQIILLQSVVLLLLIVSCENKEKFKRIDFEIQIISDGKLVQNSSSAFPDFIKKLILPIEINELGEVYIPKISFKRIDLLEDTLSSITIPMETANQIREYFEMYDYQNYKDDIDENIDNLELGKKMYIESTTDSSIGTRKLRPSEFIFKCDGNSFPIDSVNSIINFIKSSIISNNFNKVITIYLQTKGEEVPDLAIDEDKQLDDIDTDKDGIPDRLDHCKDKPGSKKNKGCPEANKEMPIAGIDPCSTLNLRIGPGRHSILFSNDDDGSTEYRVSIYEIDPPNSNLLIYQKQIRSNSLSFPLSNYISNDYKLSPYRKYKIVVNVLNGRGQSRCSKEQQFNLENESTINSTCKFN